MYDQPRSNKKRNLIIGGSLILVVGLVGAIAFLGSSHPSISSMSQITLQIEEQEFNAYLHRYSKNYAGEEYSRRLQNYRDNSAFIRLFNTQGRSWTLEVNQFADMSFEEFKAIYLPYKIPIKPRVQSSEDFSKVDIPSSVDWRNQNAVTNVKDQGQCGSCWSFSATGSIEGARAIAGKGLVSLSEQQLVDCSTSYGNQGCNGGLMDSAFEYVIDHGLTGENNYRYTAKDGTCDSTKVADVVANINSYKDVAQESSEALMTAVAQQPVSVAVEADQMAWQFYSGGIVDSGCGNKLDHGVLAVGYERAMGYYIVKNSWGASWGLSGYIKIGVQSGPGVCGIQMQPSYPVV